MLKHWRVLLFWALVLAIAVWIRWWASWNFALEHQIHTCKQTPDDCGSYNIIFFSAWQLASALNHWSTLIAAAATVAIACFTLTLKRSTDRLWDASERQLEHARIQSSSEQTDRLLELKQIEEQVRALRGGARATRELVEVSNDTERRELRAYVLVSGARVRSPHHATLRRAELTIRNFGKTPAHNLRFWMGAGVREFPLTSILEEPPDSMRLSNDVLPPGRPSVMAVPVRHGMPDLEIGLIIRPPIEATSAIYLFGRITYLDAFDQEHVTEFRQMCWGEGFAEGAVSPCEEGNTYT
jgi:hypothetical protein